MLLLFFIGVSLGTAMLFAALAIMVNLTEHAIFIGAIAFSICMIALGINAVNQEDK